MNDPNFFCLLESGIIGQQNSTVCENIPLVERFGVKLLFYSIIKNWQTIFQSPSHDGPSNQTGCVSQAVLGENEYITRRGWPH